MADLIVAEKISFGYAGSDKAVFTNLSFSLDANRRTGLIGKNGAGKTTLCKILAGKLSATGQVKSRRRIVYFPYEVPNASLAVRTVWQTVSDAEEWRLLRALRSLSVEDFDPDAPFCSYSCGEQTKILLAALFCEENAYLLIDEPTNHLDEKGRKTVADALKKKSAYLLVTHDRAFADACIDGVLYLDDGNTRFFDGSLTAFMAEKAKAETAKQAENKRLRQEIDRLTASARQIERWATAAEREKKGKRERKSGVRPDRGYLGAKAASMASHAANVKNRTEKAIREKEALLTHPNVPEVLSAHSEKFFSERLLALSCVVPLYDLRPVCAPVSFELLQGERVALAGQNGAGKSSILKAVLGKADYDGTVFRNPRLKISYVPQTPPPFCGDLAAFAERYGLDRTRLTTILCKLGVSQSLLAQDVSAYSEGQTKKLWLAKSLCETAFLYIWDEPLNFIDVESRAQIEEVLLASGISLLFTEHDAAFCRAVATRTICIDPV